MSPRILYIHGANASEISFEYIRQHLPNHVGYSFNHSTDIPFNDIVKNAEAFCKKELKNESFSIISHSMGGLIALKLLQNKNLKIEKLVTMACPFEGHRFAEFLKWVFPSYQLYNDISPSSSFIRSIRRMKFDVPIRSFVALNGFNPVFREPNDGVVTLDSQLGFKHAEFFEINLCHFEILLSNDVIDKIEEFIFPSNSEIILTKRN